MLMKVWLLEKVRESEGFVQCQGTAARTANEAKVGWLMGEKYRLVPTLGV